MTFSERLTKLRQATGMNQKDCAAALGMESSKYNKWEKGNNRPDFENVCKLADFFHVTTDYLLGKSGAKNSENVMLVDELGLTEKSIESIRKINMFSSIQPGDDKRTLLEVLNLFIEDDGFYTFIALIKKMTDPTKVKWGAYQWEGEENPTPFQLSHKIAEDSAWKTLLQDVLNGNIERIRKECANISAPYFKKLVATIEKDD